MIRVLEVLATLKRAGAETMVTSLVQRLDRTRFDPHIVTLFDATPGDLAPEIGVPVRRLGKRPGLDLRTYPRLRAAIRAVEPDIIHTHSYVLRYVLPVARVPIVHTVHNLAGQEVDRIGRWIHKAAFGIGVTPVAVAAEVARTFAAEYGFTPQIIPNGIDLTRFTPTPVRPDPHPFTILAVARLEPQKNPTILAEAVASLPFDARLLMAGEGSLRPTLEGRPRVTLLGSRTDIPQLLAQADVFALTSDYEGHPIALLEAMAAGLPVVATSVGGVPEIVGDAGMLIPPRDPHALATALTTLHSNPTLRATLAQKARQRAATFDLTAMVEAYQRLFEKVVQ